MLNEQGQTVYTTRSDVRPHLARMKAIMRSATLSANEKLVLFAIEQHADNVSGVAYPSVALLCQDTSLSKNSVMRATQGASEKGWLHVMPGKSPLDPRGNAYRVTPVHSDEHPPRIWPREG
jgi:hypothetical protein